MDQHTNSVEQHSSIAMDAESLSRLVISSDLPSLHKLHIQTLPRNLPTALTTAGHTPLHWAALSDTPTILSLLLDHSTHTDPLATAADQLGQTPLHWACVSAPLTNVIILLSHGANPEIRDAKGFTAVTHAAQYGRVDVLHLLLKIVPELANVVDVQGHTPLMWASYYDHHPATVYLLKVYDVAIDEVDESGMTALHRAAQMDYWLIVETLIRHGADWRIRDNADKSVIDVARGRTRFVLQEWDMGRLTNEQPVPQRWGMRRFALIAFYYILLAVSYWRYWPIRYLLGIGVSVFAHLCMFTSMVSHFMTTFSDPGELTKGNRETLIQYVERCLKEGVSETRLLPSAFCYTCLNVRPPRSKHSRERDVCVRRFDHECPWVNNTIGLNTHKPLLLLAISTAAAETCFITVVWRVIGSAAVESSLIDGVLAYPLLFVLAIVHATICVFCIVLFMSHVQLVIRGRTTYEHLIAMRENSIDNPYDRGAWNNIIGFLTSSGPGTGKPWAVLSARTIREVVMSSERNDTKVEEEKVLLEEV